MRLHTSIKALLILLVLVALLLALAAVLFVGEAAFSLWDRLQAAPAWVMALFAAGLAALGGLSVWVVVLIVRSGRRPRVPERSQVQPIAPTARLTAAQAAVQEILDSVDRDTLIARARNDIRAHLRGESAA